MDKQVPEPVRINDISWRLVLKAVIAGLLLIASVGLLHRLGEVVMTVVIGSFMAITLDTVVRLLQRQGVSRGWAITIVLTSVVLLGVGITAAAVHTVVTQGGKLVNEIPDLVNSITSSQLYKDLNLDQAVSPSTMKSVAQQLSQVPGLLVDIVGGAVGGIFGLVSLFMAVAFLLSGGDKAVHLLVRLFPKLSHGEGWHLVASTYNNIGQYVLGATVQAICAGTCLFLVLWVLGVPYALVLGVFMLVMDYIPLVGATIGAVPAVAVALFASSLGDGIVTCAFIIVYQQIENAVIQPRIQGKVVHLPGVAIFFSVTIGGAAFGIVGALFAVPLTSVLAIGLNQYFAATGRDKIHPPKLFDGGDPILNPDVGNPTPE